MKNPHYTSFFRHIQCEWSVSCTWDRTYRSIKQPPRNHGRESPSSFGGSAFRVRTSALDGSGSGPMDGSGICPRQCLHAAIAPDGSGSGRDGSVCMPSSPRCGKLRATSCVAREHDASPCSEPGDCRPPLGAVTQRRPAFQGQDSFHAHKDLVPRSLWAWKVLVVHGQLDTDWAKSDGPSGLARICRLGVCPLVSK